MCRVFSKIEVSLTYSRPARIAPIDQRLVTPVFEDLLKGIIVNYPVPPLPIYNYSIFLPLLYLPGRNSLSLPGYEYLIITEEDFIEQVRRLAIGRFKRGSLQKY